MNPSGPERVIASRGLVFGAELKKEKPVCQECGLRLADGTHSVPNPAGASARPREGTGAVMVDSLSRAWELRAAMRLARLWQRQGRCEETRGDLAPVYATYTEGFATPDLVYAKALLE